MFCLKKLWRLIQIFGGHPKNAAVPNITYFLLILKNFFVMQEHAATCGDDPVPRSSSKISRITCEICDKVVDFDTGFEVHVRECILKKRDKD